ncbi:MAG: DUF3426 domain-containing protein [Thermodesulfobacteriota bacterium]
MIVTCASCLTKFNLEDSKISPKGAKVRCSRCKHVFYIVAPPETKEEILEKFESFAKYHGEMMGPGPKEGKIPTPSEAEKREVAPEEEEEAFLFSEKAPPQKAEKVVPVEPVEEEKAEAKAYKPKKIARVGRRSPSHIFALIIVLILLVFGAFYLWTELESGGKLSHYIETPLQKVTALWNQIWGTEKEGLIVGDLSGYEEKIGEISLFVIEGKVSNQSRFTKKHIKIRVEIFDQNRAKVAEKETVCGGLISRGELKNLPIAFFTGEMVIQPQTEKEKITASGKAIPFVVVFRDIPSQAKEFKVEIVEAPNL